MAIEHKIKQLFQDSLIILQNLSLATHQFSLHLKYKLYFNIFAIWFNYKQGHYTSCSK